MNRLSREHADLRSSLSLKMEPNVRPEAGALRVWHIPQVPMRAFFVPVASPEEAIKILEVLADYDLFQLAWNIKPDYSNTQGLSVYAEEGWEDWESEDGLDIDAYALSLTAGVAQ